MTKNEWMFPIHFLVKGINGTWRPIATQTRKGNSQGTSFSGGLVGTNRRELFLLGLSFKWALCSRPNSPYFLLTLQMRYVGNRKWIISLSPLNTLPRTWTWNYGEDHNDDYLSEFCRIALFYERELSCIYGSSQHQTQCLVHHNNYHLCGG